MFQILATLVLVGLTTTTRANSDVTFLTCPNYTAPFAAAIGVANTLQSMGYADILGIVSGEVPSHFDGLPDVTSKYSLPAIDAINTWYCHPDIPLAQTNELTSAVREPTVPEDVTEYITNLSDPTQFCQDFNRKNVKDPVEFYTDVLTKAENKSVTIVAIGFLTNLHNLYYSSGGPALIEAKVKELVVQGGSCNVTSNPHGAGYNLLYDLPSAEVVTKWPSPITFFPGFIAGQVTGIKSELNISDKSPVRFVYETANFTGDFKFGPHDILATYYAILGLSDGSFTHGNANDTGGLQFVPNPKSPVAVKEDTVWNYAVTPPASQHYLILNNTIESIANKINGLISCYGKEQPVCPGQKVCTK
ncbi:hypothetical protein Clacol_007665 [Clathrus columnatus]|uniref:Inosine/uridine-preferring nucleoside hydrolase domain-containing protein n=1 Tax=Clathrus columnatus TaxID=1419009 RepID=A0AAV5AFI9_9AGAM|nr:hypothetical protein Clacol_007665 [Clathrus columnatus]